LPALILLAIEDVTDREYYKRDLEELVKKRTAELIVAREEAEKRKQIAETALSEIKKLKDQLEAVERDHIIRVLKQTQWKVSGKNSAPEILGLNRSTLRARMRKFDIKKP